MPANHLGPFPVNSGIGSILYLSNTKKCPKNLIIFIHGFLGKAVETWEEFPDRLTSMSEFNDSDIIFYGYESLKTQTTSAASQFCDFIEQVNNPNKYSKRESNCEYSDIIIISHSLGSNVTRIALMEAKGSGKTWLSKCKMILFAPAHNGARIGPLILSCAPGFMKVIAGLGAYHYPVLEDLMPKSKCLEELYKLTKKFLYNNDGDFTIAKGVIWAKYDKVVYNNRFFNDPNETTIDKVSHTEVCKPIFNSYMKPIELLLNATK